MHFPATSSFTKISLIAYLSLYIFLSAYSQQSQVDKEIDEAINKAQNGHYEQAIPVLRKYTEVKGFDDLKTLKIIVYLNLSYLVTKNKALDEDKVNMLIDAYVEKYGISQIDKFTCLDEMELLFLAGTINGSIGNYEKMVLYLSLIKKHYDEKHLVEDEFYSSILYPLTLGYFNLNDYLSVIDVGQTALKVNNELFGEVNEASLKILDLIYLSYHNNNEHILALKNLQKRVAIGKELLGERNLEYINSLHSLAIMYSDLGEYKKALEIKLKVVELRKEVLGEKHPEYLTSLNNLAIEYSNLGNYQKALEICLNISEIAKEVFGEQNPNYLTILNNLASTHREIGNYKKALEIKLKVVELRKEVLGEKHTDYLMSLNNLAIAYSDLGNFGKALEMQLKVVDLGKEVLGEKNPDYFNILSNLASAYSDVGNYGKAVEIGLWVVNLRKEVLGEKHPEYLTSLNNLAIEYSNLGNYQKALEIQLNVVDLRKEVLGEKHPDYLTSLSNLSVCYFDLTDYRKAFEIQLKVVDLRKEILGENHSDYLNSLSNLSVFVSEIGNYKKALEIKLKVVELGKEVLGEKHPDYLASLDNLATEYKNLGDYQKALEIDLWVVGLKKEVLGEMHPDYFLSLNNLAADYNSLHNFTESLEIYLKVADLFKMILVENHPNYLTILGNLAITEFYLSENFSALSHYLEMLDKCQERVIEYFSLMTENQREQFWKRYANDFNFYPMFFEKVSHFHPEGAGDAYNISLFSKGLILNTTLDFDILLAEKGTPEAIAKFEEMKLLKLDIQRFNEKPISERYLNVDSLENIAQQKETELVKLSKEYGDYTRNLKITWQEVQSKLHEKDVAIEFVEYPTLSDTVKYAALVLRKGWQYPKMINLFRKDQIDEFINQDQDKMYSNGFVGKQIKKLIWEPLEEVISPGERVYFSPAGIIHQLAIENLSADDSTTLGDQYQMYRLSSTKELAFDRPVSPIRSSVLFGGLEYAMEDADMKKESTKYEFEKSRSYLAFRGYNSDTTTRSGWEYLKGTKPEVEQIAQLMREKQYEVKEYTGVSGNEESFKSLSGEPHGIIHLATHGFFLPIEESRENPFMMQRIGDQQLDKPFIDPMLRSGLIMSGGNRAWLGEVIPENIEDGVLTAKEISHLDLRGTDLVVLSACETGLGEVSSEGVFGLQRSFKQAGVRTIVMSLWDVHDDATRLMMTKFYEGLLSGKEKREAFLEAKKSCKEKFPLPQYWAAFILLN